MALLLLVAILVGVALPVQAGVNAQLRVGVGHPLFAALISFAVGTAALLGLNILLRVPLPSGEAAARFPWWYWIGGLLGALYIYLAIVLAPRLGAATLVAAIVTGQMMASLILDHFGWVGFPQQSLTPTRLVGALLVIGGVLLIQRRQNSAPSFAPLRTGSGTKGAKGTYQADLLGHDPWIPSIVGIVEAFVVE